MQSLITDTESGILYRSWIAPGQKAILILVHGYGAHSGRWGFLADFFLKEGISSFAIELKGFGFTEGLKGHIDSFDIYLEDIKRLFEIARSGNPDKKIFLIGESAGALIATLFTNIEANLPDGLILLSPALKNKLKFSIFDYIKIFVLSLILPKKQITMPFKSDMCSRDIEYQKYMECDKGEHRVASARLLFETAVAQILLRVYKKIIPINLPLAVFLAGSDKIMDAGVSKKFFNKLLVKDKVLIEYPDMYHSLSVDRDRDKVFRDMFEWIKQRIIQ